VSIPVPLWQRISTVPAQVLGLTETGKIAIGRLADPVLFDHDLKVEATIVRGRIAFSHDDKQRTTLLSS
jgi:N-acetylglucosamine-6-phosphate deacetylase